MMVALSAVLLSSCEHHPREFLPGKWESSQDSSDSDHPKTIVFAAPDVVVWDGEAGTYSWVKEAEYSTILIKLPSRSFTIYVRFPDDEVLRMCTPDNAHEIAYYRD
jgi:hypothetical protein